MNALTKGAPAQKAFEPIHKTDYKFKRKEDSSLQEPSPGRWQDASSGTALSKEQVFAFLCYSQQEE